MTSVPILSLEKQAPLRSRVTQESSLCHGDGTCTPIQPHPKDASSGGTQLRTKLQTGQGIPAPSKQQRRKTGQQLPLLEEAGLRPRHLAQSSSTFFTMAPMPSWTW